MSTKNDQKQNNKNISAWADTMKEYIQRLYDRNKGSYEGEDSFFAFPSEKDDPVNGMHEITPDSDICIHCGKHKSEF